MSEDPAPAPIGPERLRALRQAILDGTYPLDEAVHKGLANLFRQGGPASPGSKEPS